jgi:hypothetical protein
VPSHIHGKAPLNPKKENIPFSPVTITVFSPSYLT